MASRTGAELSRSLVRFSSQPHLRHQQYICKQCRRSGNSSLPFQAWRSIQGQQRHQQHHHSLQTSTYRTFTTSLSTHKKSSTNPKSPRKSPPVSTLTKDTHIPDNKHTRNLDAEPDPYDHSDLQTSIDHAIARLKDALTKTRDAGRVSTTMIEELPVDLNIKGSTTHGGSAHKERTTINTLASVVPKGGRTMQIFASEESHVKPMLAAVAASPYSLSPQVDAQNPLLIVIPVPPTTAETRSQAAAEAKKCFDRAGLEVRNARGDAQKRHKKMEQLKVVVPDELRKAHKGMEDVAKMGQDEVKRVYEGALKALQNS